MNDKRVSVRVPDQLWKRLEKLVPVVSKRTGIALNESQVLRLRLVIERGLSAVERDR